MALRLVQKNGLLVIYLMPFWQIEGELEGKNAENLINALGIKIMNTPPYRADWKGIIEQNFKTTSDRVKPFMPGVVNPDLRERAIKTIDSMQNSIYMNLLKL